MRMKALGANLPTVLSGGCSGSLTARAGRWKPSTKAPASPPRRTARRDGERASCSKEYIGSLLRLTVARGALDGLADADIGAAAADIPRHRSVDVRIIRMWRGSEQRCRRHDLTRLAIAALDHFQVQPSLLHPRSCGRGVDALDRGDGAIPDGADWQETRTERFAIDMHRAGAALRDAAAELSAGHAEHIAQHPKQRHVAGRLEASAFAIDVQCDHNEPPPRWGISDWLRA